MGIISSSYSYKHSDTQEDITNPENLNMSIDGMKLKPVNTEKHKTSK